VSPSSSDLRPLALGELIDRSATFWRKHLKPLFLLSFGFNLVTYIITKGLQLTMQQTQATLQRELTKGGATSELVLAYAQLVGALAVTLVLTFWVYWLSTLVVARYVVPAQLGEAVKPADGLRRGLSKLGALTVAYLCSLLWAVGITLLLVLPGGALTGVGAWLAAADSGGIVGFLLAGLGVLLGGFGVLAALLWYFLRFSLLAPVLALEDVSALKAFRRSGELLSGRVGPGFAGRVRVRAMILVTVVSSILVAVSLLSGLPALFIQFAYSNPLDPAGVGAVPQTLLVPAELLQVVGQALFSPLGLVFYAMFYLDMRMRREGLDLEKRLEARAPKAVAAA
jgi:hypothetical protein